MWSRKLKSVIDKAVSISMDYSHEYVTVEHLLLALVDEEEVLIVFVNCNINVVQLQLALCAFLQKELVNIVVDNPQAPKLTIGVKRVLERVLLRVREQQKGEISAISILLEIFSERDSHAAYFLHMQNISCMDVIEFIACGRDGFSPNYPDMTAPIQSMLNYDRMFTQPKNQPQQSQQRDPSEVSILQQHSLNLNQRALANQLDPVISRTEEKERVFRFLCCKKKNNVILVGEPGVGKTAVVEGIADAIAKKTAPKMLWNYVVHSLDIGSVLAGTKYRGDFEERIKNLMCELHKKENIILFIDEIHSIIGAGATNGSALDASNLLKPILAQGTIRCIGATTYKEYNQVLMKDRAFLRRFHKIDVLAPSLDDTAKILMGIKHRYEQHYALKYTPGSIAEIIRCADRYMSNHSSNMPDKAVSALDEIGAFYAIQNQDRSRKEKRVISSREASRIASILFHTPLNDADDSDVGILVDMEKKLRQSIYGQDNAISVVCDRVKVAKLRLQNVNKPIGCFLFYGPTGVGKTELAKQLANSLSLKLIRLDMSEYSESHSVARIVGSPPGYVGYEQGGLLADYVYHNQHCVLLLDEIEKAHHNIHNMLLQVMDYGVITDSTGREVNFTHSIIIMTTNLGSQSFDKLAMGFNTSDNDISIKEIEQFFSPEFRNRLSAIIKFNNLTPFSIELIARKAINALVNRLKERNVLLVINDDVMQYIVEKNKSIKNGARFLEAFIDDNITKPLADLLIKQGSSKNLSINASMGDDAGMVQFTAIETKKRMNRRTVI